MNRREFAKTAAGAATAFTILPSHVIAGRGHIPPSEKITVANIGCRSQEIVEMPALLKHPRIQVVAVCDVNRYSTDYLDWSDDRLMGRLRSSLKDPSWGAGIKGIPGGREFGKQYVDAYYGKFGSSGSSGGCAMYEDYRELLADQSDIDAVKIMTPDHHHAGIAIAALRSGKHVITHKPIANRISEARAVMEHTALADRRTHLLAWKNNAEYRKMRDWIKQGVIGEIVEIHNWTNRPVWPQWHLRPTERMPVPEGFNWELWLGPVPDMPYHPHYTHNVFRGWYDFGGGAIADMGHYSLFPLFEVFGIDRPPTAVRAHATTNRRIDGQVCVNANNDAAFPYSSEIKFTFPAQRELAAFDLYWYDGGMKPFAPDEVQAQGREMAGEGLMIVGAEGTLVSGFLGQGLEVFPSSKRRELARTERSEKPEKQEAEDFWVDAILSGVDSPGNFLNARCVTETLNLGAVALRAGKPLNYDSESMRITNNPSANRYLTRDYRNGWEIA